MDRAMSCVTVFGGTGFLGRRVVQKLCECGATVRIASRRPGRAERDNVKQIAADPRDERSVEAAVAGADGVVNAISLYVEHGSDTFHSVHVETAARIASVARRVGVKRLVHLSGIGADAASPSPYIRSRGEGEAAVQAAFLGVVVVRPAAMFAPDDGFLTTILRLLRMLPAYPIFGDGRTRLQPVYADDVAAAITQLLRQSKKPSPIHELAGPRVYSYEELLRTIARTAGLRPMLIRMPFALWDAVAGVAEMLPQPPLTRNQVELMQIDTTASENLPGFRALGISPRSLEEELEAMLRQSNTETQLPNRRRGSWQVETEVTTPIVLPWPLQSGLEAATRVLFDLGDRPSVDFLRPAGEAALVSPELSYRGACSRTRSRFSSAASRLL